MVDGKIVLAQYRGEADPDTGGAYTVKRYASIKESDGEGGWRHRQIELVPLNNDFSSIVFGPDEVQNVRVVAEFVRALGVV